MGKDWDKALPDKEIWSECLRVLKAGSFAFVMSIPRSDCLSRMIISLEDAGFWVNFTPIYWVYASGFPKAQNIGKAVDKKPYRKERLELKSFLDNAIKGSGKTRKQIDSECGFTACSYTRTSFREDDGWGEALPDIDKWFTMQGVIGFDDTWDWLIKENERQLIGVHKSGISKAFDSDYGWGTGSDIVSDTIGRHSLEGSYGGFQPKPAVEVIIVAMKPLSEKTFVDQALKNRKGITWLDDCRIPYESEDKPKGGFGGMDAGIGKPLEHQEYRGNQEANPTGRFPANLLCSDDMLNDGRDRVSGIGNKSAKSHNWTHNRQPDNFTGGDSGSFSRYFDLDKWFSERIKELPESVQKTFPFLIVPKASKREKNKGLEGLPSKPTVRNANTFKDGLEFNIDPRSPNGGYKVKHDTKMQNNHPTVKPLKLMSYLITLGSRAGDMVLDPFGGSGTTALASKLLGRHCIISEIEEKYCEISANRCRQMVFDLSK